MGKKAAKAKGKAKATGAPITMPTVSAKDLEEARGLLQSTAEDKRQRASLSYYLKANNQWDEYQSWSVKARKDFLDLHFADKLGKGDVKVSNTSTKSFGSTTGSTKEYDWMSKYTMQQKMGPDKTDAKINFGIRRVNTFLNRFVPRARVGTHANYLSLIIHLFSHSNSFI